MTKVAPDILIYLQKKYHIFLTPISILLEFISTFVFIGKGNKVNQNSFFPSWAGPLNPTRPTTDTCPCARCSPPFSCCLPCAAHLSGNFSSIRRHARRECTCRCYAPPGIRGPPRPNKHLPCVMCRRWPASPACPCTPFVAGLSLPRQPRTCHPGVLPPPPLAPGTASPCHPRGQESLDKPIA
jgi:hypothetical protein